MSEFEFVNRAQDDRGKISNMTEGSMLYAHQPRRVGLVVSVFASH